ncbi:aminopeptidase P family protein [Cytophagaceae bacterium DM2B3-1]|uniref:Xaa-Pro aminopeptidase n=2 Tax=Xanthocytophaga TaxID=3078918 RepID=A0ABT7CQ55_9BACT|nr:MULTISPECIES: aminopeptidase P family protein [Xanthocytophaga]MDJ1473413.1 aminopeptidase P family protein [Xanthocytophaga flavus]MDJ1495852.1 aminopeptidase P family protein [Xanthocytophaga flavus]MDJ1505452.1 aminopeptidase P family protein [Xanthocytophaga agilis]
MKYAPIPKELFIKNRENFAKLLKPKSIAIFHSNDVMPTNADGTMGFRQNNDLFYLSGIDQEETVLIIAPDFPDPKFREILFVRETSELIAIWEGAKLTKPQATEASGITNIQWTDRFLPMLQILLSECDNIYLNANEHTRAVVEVETRDARFVKYCKDRFPLHNYVRVAPLMHNLRAIKSEKEIELMQHACDITEKGFRRVLKFTKPGVLEYEIEAEFAHEFIRNAGNFAYPPIIASGANACVLHYVENNQPCKDGDVILLDVGAGYANYAADMTRSIPVNGRFTPRQRQVYDAVLRVMRESTKMLVTGNLWDEYHKEVGKIMESELIGLGLLDKNEVAKQNPDNPLYKKYFMHGTSHFLGLDVHDVGNKYRRFEPGMVFTCEPGIYIPEEGLGIRLENNILITENGNTDLMATIPVEAEEIEEIMNSK